MEYGILLRFASIEPSLTEVNCGSLPLAISFSFSPDPLLPALPCLLTSNNPPPPGRGTSRLQSVRKPAMTRLACFLLCPSALSRCSFAIARSCPFLLASARSRSLSPICGVPLSVQPPDTESGERISFRQFPAPRLLQSTLERRGGDAVSPTSPRPAVSPFRLPCLLAALSFLYKPGMVIGYSAATVIYFS